MGMAGSRDKYRLTDQFDSLSAVVLAQEPIASVRTLKQQVWDVFSMRGLPTLRHEHWKHTDFQSVLHKPWIDSRQVEVRSKLGEHDIQRVRHALGPYKQAVHRLVWINGILESSLGTLAPECLCEQNFLGSISEYQRRYPEAFADLLAQHCDFSGHFAGAMLDDPVFLLNGALFSDGLLMLISDPAVLKQPVEIFYVEVASQSRVDRPVYYLQHLYDFCEGSMIELAEHHISLEVSDDLVKPTTLASGSPYWVNITRLMHLRSNATCRHTIVQQEGVQSAHFASFYLRQAQGSLYRGYALDRGGMQVRHTFHAALEGPDAACHVWGLTQSSGKTHVDRRVGVTHIAGHCDSSQDYRSVLDDHAQGAFNSTVCVRPHAQKTKAKQSSKTLLLSQTAQMNTQPELHIQADDVQCVHGATLGRLDEAALFYLRARGLALEDARALLIQAFMDEILRQFPGVGLHVD
jgi:Fe-S cluster assembly protein SufD